MKNEIFQKDLFRYYGEHEETLKNKIFRPNELKYIFLLRKLQTASSFFRIIYKLQLRHLSALTSIQISEKTKIGEGFYIGHCGRIIINPRAIIGKNVNVATGVTIGQENRGKRKGTPIIGDNCWIGTNSVIVGNIRIGSDVLIAPLTFVNFDVPDHSIVVGNPAKIIYKENATEGYINRRI